MNGVFAMVFLHFSHSHFLSVCVFNVSQSTYMGQTSGRKERREKRPIVEMNEIELIQPTNRAIERKYMYNMMKKGRFCFETHQKIRILYVVLRYVMYVDKLLFWHWQNAQHAAQQRKIHRERKGARPRMGERECARESNSQWK